MLNQVIREENRKAWNGPSQGPKGATGVATPDKENETSPEEGRMHALRCCQG